MKVLMSPFDPDAKKYKYRTVSLRENYNTMRYIYSYLRYMAAAEAGLLPRIDNDPDYDFEENYVEPIRYCLILFDPFIF